MNKKQNVPEPDCQCTHPFFNHDVVTKSGCLVKYCVCLGYQPTPPNSKDEIREQLDALMLRHGCGSKHLRNDVMQLIHAHDKALIAAVRPEEKTPDLSGDSDDYEASGWNAALADLDANSKKVLGE